MTRISDERVNQRCDRITARVPANMYSEDTRAWLDLRDARAEIARLKAEVRAGRKLLSTDGTARLEQETSGFYQEELDYQTARAAVGEV